MLPVVRGEATTRRHILLYLGATLLGAVALGATTRLDWLYAVTIVLVGGCFCGQPFDCSANAPNRPHSDVPRLERLSRWPADRDSRGHPPRMNLSAHTREWVSSVEIERRTARFWIVVVLLEGFLLLAYFALTTAEPTTEVRYLVYPFV